MAQKDKRNMPASTLALDAAPPRKPQTETLRAGMWVAKGVLGTTTVWNKTALYLLFQLLDSEAQKIWQTQVFPYFFWPGNKPT
jgi:hypothetical protein